MKAKAGMKLASTALESSPDFANPCFLGSSGENAEIFERLLVEFMRDHIYWRKNFHPEDPVSIPVSRMQDPEYLEFIGRVRTEMQTLAAALKRSVPIFNPRYMGHMVSDSLLPGLLAQLVTTLYNPNNVSEEAAPVTLQMELEVGDQLAAMLGYGTESEQSPRAWGHLTSGGTLANFEALVNLRSIRCYALALKDAAVSTGARLQLDLGPRGPIEALDDWTLFNLPMDIAMSLPGQVRRLAHGKIATVELHHFRQALQEARIEALGPAAFSERHPLTTNMLVFTPMTAHYSWRKAAKVLGLGTRQIEALPEDGYMRLQTNALGDALQRALETQTPVLGVVAVLGTTEFGTIDPLHEVIAIREKLRKSGIEFGVHVDAAWGGYLASIFRQPDGSLASREEIRQEFKYFPSQSVYSSFAALAAADSVTVDPHKLGYLPYGIGGIVWRDHRVTDFLEEQAAYLFDEGQSPTNPASIKQRFGQYILEGSKPGAAAAAAWVSHRVLPLDRRHFGRLQRQTIVATEYFFDRLEHLRDCVKEIAHIVVPFEPDTNLVCIACNPSDNRALAHANAFGRRLYAHLCVDPKRPVQVRDFFSSRTAVRRDMIGPDALTRVLSELDIDPDTFVELVQDPTRQSSSLFLLRHTLMNPWLMERLDGENYIDKYCEYLEQIIRLEVLGPPTAPAGRVSA